MVPNTILAQGGHSFWRLFEFFFEPSIGPLRALFPSFAVFRVCIFQTLLTISKFQFSGVLQHPTADSIFQLTTLDTNQSNAILFSATFPRPGREPLRIGTRGFRDWYLYFFSLAGLSVRCAPVCEGTKACKEAKAKRGNQTKPSKNQNTNKKSNTTKNTTTTRSLSWAGYEGPEGDIAKELALKLARLMSMIQSATKANPNKQTKTPKKSHPTDQLIREVKRE